MYFICSATKQGGVILYLTKNYLYNSKCKLILKKNKVANSIIKEIVNSKLFAKDNDSDYLTFKKNNATDVINNIKE